MQIDFRVRSFILIRDGKKSQLTLEDSGTQLFLRTLSYAADTQYAPVCHENKHQAGYEDAACFLSPDDLFSFSFCLAFMRESKDDFSCLKLEI
jgi:hypothetical protein